MINTGRIRAQHLALLLVAIINCGGCRRHSGDSGKAGGPKKTRPAVTALGRITPGRSVISIAAEPGSRIAKLEVKDNQKVKAGDPLVYLETYALRKAERDAAKAAFDDAWERMETETAYTHALVDQNHEAVQLLEISVEHERKELQRFESLLASKTVQQQAFDAQKFLVQSREGELAKAKAELRSAESALARVRSTVGSRSAEARLKSAEEQLNLSVIRAPIDGEILKVFTYPGENVGKDPILKMGNTDDMHVIAEVHESDVGAVRVGQRASITSDALPEPVQGVVEEIADLIHKNDVLNIDPREDKDTRIVEVRIKLDNSAAASHFTHLEVSVRIDLDAPIANAKSAGQ